MLPLYVYPPLSHGHFRLLKLLPGDESAPLCGVLTTVPLASSPEYEAISYTWGGLDFSHSLAVLSPDTADHVHTWLGDQKPSSNPSSCHMIPITSHLSQLLFSLRLNTTPRLLWVDGVCVNQTDIAEGNDQVLLMRQIYTCALRVVIWLGEASQDGSSDRAMVFLKRMGSHNKWVRWHCWNHGVRQGSETSSECGAGTYVDSWDVENSEFGGNGEERDGEGRDEIECTVAEATPNHDAV